MHRADPAKAVEEQESATIPADDVDLERLGITITGITSVVALRNA